MSPCSAARVVSIIANFMPMARSVPSKDFTRLGPCFDGARVCGSVRFRRPPFYTIWHRRGPILKNSRLVARGKTVNCRKMSLAGAVAHFVHLYVLSRRTNLPSEVDLRKRVPIVSERRFITVDGNEAAASIAHRTNEVIAIYPITPASPMGEFCDAWSAEGRQNIFGTVPEVIEMQSEGGRGGDGPRGTPGRAP